jgi:spore germination cell wall hydrolase CwlJ-like protein
MAKRHHEVFWPIAVVLLVVISLTLALATSPAGNRQQPTETALPDLPELTPLALMPLASADARAANAAQAFVTADFPAAAPYRFTGDSLAEARAADCLAAALLYEAGDNADDQRPVAQVVLNRVRHPAYPGSICGVVFQGAERRTGCQFTFTCDGALRRRYSDAAWQRARGVAIDFMNGAVDRRVGLATHYHTDWVRPYWSSSLDKLAQIGSHIFFRWRGYWGTPSAFRGSGGAPEPLIGRLAALSSAHANAPDAALALIPVEQLDDAEIATASAAAVRRIIPQTERRLGDTIILTLDRGQSADNFPAMAEAACGGRSYCVVMGWTNPMLAPDSEGMNDMARASMSFSYLRDENANLERALWNCDEFRRENRAQCMRR